jgi:hypothetical protein
MNTPLYRLLLIPLCLELAGCALESPRPRTAAAARTLFDLGSMTPGAAAKKDVALRLGRPNAISRLADGREQWLYVRTQGFDLRTFSTANATDYSAEYTFDASGLLAEATYRAVPAANPWLP